MPAKDADYTYDVFISYSHADKDWAHGWLLDRLEAAGVEVCIDFRDFDVGVPSLVDMERAVDHSRHTLLVLTPAWVASEWTEFEELLTQTADPAARRRRLLLRFGDHMRDHATQIRAKREVISGAPAMPLRLLAEAEEAYGKLLAVVVGLIDGELSAIPEGATWSIRQVIEHLVQTERWYLEEI